MVLWSHRQRAKPQEIVKYDYYRLRINIRDLFIFKFYPNRFRSQKVFKFYPNRLISKKNTKNRDAF